MKPDYVYFQSVTVCGGGEEGEASRCNFEKKQYKGLIE